MAVSCKPNQILHETPYIVSGNVAHDLSGDLSGGFSGNLSDNLSDNLSGPQTNKALHLVSRTFYKLWARYKNHRAQVELRQLSDHLLRDINQPRKKIDPLGKRHAWNDPRYIDIRRWW
ncbi:DUF1127 domain-containing protein [Kiloniella antarctica]|uniref:DUF1127 domain-containing protein n=1 Tax=Kiloniella antarctica TaxID=1550907 RepID=A0ABW5BLF5_9PROT